MVRHCLQEFGFLPRTFCLPADTKLLRKVRINKNINRNLLN
jgi:hypothetical protein